MLKLNNEQAAAAWEDYKKFHNIEDHKVYAAGTTENAFKFAFALAMDAAGKAEPEKKPYIPQQMELIPGPEPIKKKFVKTGITREFKGRVNRTFAQRKKEAQLVASFLKGSQNGYKVLKDITLFMQISGCDHWNDNSASGFMKDAMKHFPRIKRIGQGLYKYEF